jgi:hypothetical protein
MTNLNKLKALALAATRGVWDENVWCCEYDYGWAATGPCHKQDDDEDNVELCPESAAGIQAENDAAYIAAASPDVVLSLIEELEAYRECLKFYARPSDYYGYEDDESDFIDLETGRVHELNGRRAREVLNKFGGRE